MRKLVCMLSLFALSAVFAGGVDRIAARLARLEAFDQDKDRLQTVYTNCAARLDRPAEDMVIPLESHPDGSVKMDAAAERAQIFEKEGLVWCGGVIVREYDMNGSVKMELSADNCVVDRGTKSGWLEGCAVGTYGNTRLEGRGIYVSFRDKDDLFLKIYSGVVVTSTDIKFEGVKL